jgi:hypothetical protein
MFDPSRGAVSVSQDSGTYVTESEINIDMPDLSGLFQGMDLPAVTDPFRDIGQPIFQPPVQQARPQTTVNIDWDKGSSGGASSDLDVDDGTTTVNNVDELTLSGTNDATVTVSDGGGGAATATIDVDVESTIGSASGGGWDLSLVIKVHFNGDTTATGQVLDTNDWRDRFVSYKQFPSVLDQPGDNEIDTDTDLSNNEDTNAADIDSANLYEEFFKTDADSDTVMYSNAQLWGGATDIIDVDVYVDNSNSGKLTVDFNHDNNGGDAIERYFAIFIRGTAKLSTITASDFGNL